MEAIAGRAGIRNVGPGAFYFFTPTTTTTTTTTSRGISTHVEESSLPLLLAAASLTLLVLSVALPLVVRAVSASNVAAGVRRWLGSLPIATAGGRAAKSDHTSSSPSETTPLLAPSSSSSSLAPDDVPVAASSAYAHTDDDADGASSVAATVQDSVLAPPEWEIDTSVEGTSLVDLSVPPRSIAFRGSWSVGPAVVLSLLLLSASVQWEFANQTSGARKLYPWLFLAQLIIAPLAFFASVRVIGYAPVEGENELLIKSELDRRFYSGILTNLSVYYGVFSLGWLVATALGVSLLNDGRISAYFLFIIAAHATLTLLMGIICAVVRNSVPVIPIRRKLVDGKPPSPELDASILSRLSFSWFDSVMSYGYKNDLTLNDLWQLNPQERIEVNVQQYNTLRSQHPNASLLFIIFMISRTAFISQFALVLVSTALFFSGPFFLNRVLNFLSHRHEPDAPPEWIAYAFVFGLFFTALLRYGVEGQVSLLGQKLGIRSANALSGLIYRKSLRRSPHVAVKGDDQGATVGKIVSLMSVDAQTVGQWIGVAYSPLITLIQIITCIAALCYVLGYAALTGIVLMVLLLGSGAPLAGYLNKKFFEIKKLRDQRVNAMNEVLQGIKIIKLLAWEKEFEKKVDGLREKELTSMFRALFAGSMNRVLWFSAPLLTTFVTLATYTLVAGKELDATVAFTSLSLFNLLRGPLQTFADTISSLLETWVSFKRIDAFLKEEDLEQFTDPSSNIAKDSSPGVLLAFDNASFEWSTNAKAAAPAKKTWRDWIPFVKKPAASLQPAAPAAQEEENVFRLTDLDGQFLPEKLSVVIGATGAGKSSLILALLGEMRRTHGRRSCPVDPFTLAPSASPFSSVHPLGVAYVPQVPWLTNATIRDNILFGEKYDESRYKQVIEACALAKDFETLEGGDQTEVGEKGINLSGGQKQRLSLARAAYSYSPWVLMDDPLSAVDAPTARHLYERCILGLMAGRTRILVTNAVGLALPRADFVTLVENGRVIAQGSVEAVLDDLSCGRVPITAFGESILQSSELIQAERQKYAASDAESVAGTSLVAAEGAPHEDGKDGLTAEEAERKKKAKLVEDEEMAKGSVKFEVYWLFFSAMGGVPYFIVLFAGYSINLLLNSFLDIIIAQWTKSYEVARAVLGATIASLIPAVVQAPAIYHGAGVDTLSGIGHSLTIAGNGSTVTTMEEPPSDDPTAFYLKLYAFFGFLTILSIAGRLIILLLGEVRAAREMHQRMLKTILRSPLRFFEVTPMGRIINRFSKDMMAVDFEVPISTGNSTYFIIAILVVVSVVTVILPGLTILLIPLGYLYLRIGLFYIRTSRSLKRISSVVRSPIFSHFTETLNGVSIIRAFHHTRRFVAESSRRFDDSNRANYFLNVSNLWLSVRIQAVGATVMLGAGCLILLSGLGASMAGLCLNFTLTVSDLLISLVRMQSWMEMSMNSIERVDEYLKLEPEAPAVIADHRAPADWPHAGRISIQNLEMRYSADTPLVLHGVSAEIAPREKVGVVGRTGAGKSTLALAFFRIMEPAGGTVVIDGVDIRELGVEDLRSHLTIIPQDPVLFAGTVRSNLDPFGKVADADLWNALRRAHLVPNGGGSSSSSSGSGGGGGGSSESAAVAAESSEAPAPGVEPSVSDTSSIVTASPSSKPKNEFVITLDTPIAEGGSNLSAGQRQLLCLARALAKTSKIIVLDEATASVDTETDARIQETIRTEFSTCTVFTIAHRLKTIADYDRIIVLDQGRIIENGSPLELIETSAVGEFKRMCEETGEFDELYEIARSAQKKDRE
ncbi:hypothetical protein DFJ73DRAFT_34803 [Zopfochytrium polystomum]|nr:hypothetical protein DFJ73DRAFT_34803 [Zopfochytrium polystomum]